MGLFFGRPKITAQDKEEPKAALSRTGTCFKRLETSKSIDTQIAEREKHINEYEIVRRYEAKGVRLTMSSKKMHPLVVAEMPRLERETIEQGSCRLQRDMAKLSTDAGKKRKAERFSSELDFYYPRLQLSIVEYIRGLRQGCLYINE